MLRLVILQILSVPEELPTIRTSKTFPFVSHHVFFEIVAVVKPSSTNFTKVRIPSCVVLSVSFQTTFGGKRFLAVGARKQLFSFHHSLSKDEFVASIHKVKLIQIEENI